MVQKSRDIRKPSGRSRGRPRQYDEAAVVQAAIPVFIANGFEATTLADLEEATGVDRSTLYNSLGGKKGLFERAASAYLDSAERGLFGPLLADAGDPLDSLAALFERLRSGVGARDDSDGCLIVNDMVGGALPEASARYREMLETGLRAALQRAAASGAMPSERVEARLSLLEAAVLAANLVARQSGSADEVAAILDGAIGIIDDWR